MNNSKILFLITSNYPFGIYETFLEEELKHLEKKFDKVVILTRYAGNNNTKRYTSKSTDVIRIPEKSILNRINIFLLLFSPILYIELFYVFKSRKKIFQKSKTVINSMLNAYFLKNEVRQYIELYSQYENYILYSYWLDDSAIAICLLQKTHKRAIKISRAHGWDLYYERSKNNFLPFRRFLFSELTKIYTISNDGRDYLRGLSKNKGCEIQTFRLGTDIVTKKQDSFKTESNTLVICSCSYIVPVKRIELIYLSLQSFSGINIKWFHIGKGHLNFDYQEEIRNCIELNKKDDLEIHFLGDKSNAAVLDFFNDSEIDLFINLSSSEGIPVSIMEAMSFGIPAIATDVGGTNEIVNSKNGFLLSSNPKPEEVAQVIHDFNNFNELDKTKMRNNAFETWNEKYNSEKNYSAFVEDIASL